MTLAHLRSQLIGHFSREDTFRSDDFRSLRIDDDAAEIAEPLIRAALADLVVIGLIVAANDNLWVLRRPLGADGQTLHLSLPVATGIAETINTFMLARKLDEMHVVDPLQITENDIITLLDILGDILDTDPDDPAHQLPQGPHDPEAN